LSYPDDWKKAPPDRRELRKRRQLERNHVSEADILVVLEHDKQRRAAAEAKRETEKRETEDKVTRVTSVWYGDDFEKRFSKQHKQEQLAKMLAAKAKGEGGGSI
jgi:hypothetical protein